MRTAAFPAGIAPGAGRPWPRKPRPYSTKSWPSPVACMTAWPERHSPPEGSITFGWPKPLTVPLTIPRSNPGSTLRRPPRRCSTT